MSSIQAKAGLSVFEGMLAEEVWEASVKLGFPCAMWQLPHTNEVKLLISMQHGVSYKNPELEKLPAGFAVAPFSWQGPDTISFLEGDIIITYQSGKATDVVNRLGEEHPDIKRIADTASSLSEIIKADSGCTLQGTLLTSEEAKDRYKRTVEIAVAAIRNNEFKKVVLSRTKDIAYDTAFQPALAFHKLVKEYPHAFVSLVNLPEQKEIWLGASPETLVRQAANGKFSTMALAGTQRADDLAGALIPKYDIRWGQKEIEEHALVSRYIVECFKKIRLREYIESGPKTFLAGNVYHLRTEFDVDTEAANFAELASTMLKLLHPTSAVCGEPLVISRKFLTEMEGYDRSLYSGWLGPVQIDGQTDIFVNLRSLRLKEGIATLFAGAGITEDSVPQLEWEETELKCNTLLNVIGV